MIYFVYCDIEINNFWDFSNKTIQKTVFGANLGLLLYIDVSMMLKTNLHLKALLQGCRKLDDHNAASAFLG